jgi:hypothetical protein
MWKYTAIDTGKNRAALSTGMVRHGPAAHVTTIMATISVTTVAYGEAELMTYGRWDTVAQFVTGTAYPGPAYQAVLQVIGGKASIAYGEPDQIMF